MPSFVSGGGDFLFEQSALRPVPSSSRQSGCPFGLFPRSLDRLFCLLLFEIVLCFRDILLCLLYGLAALLVQLVPGLVERGVGKRGGPICRVFLRGILRAVITVFCLVLHTHISILHTLGGHGGFIYSSFDLTSDLK